MYFEWIENIDGIVVQILFLDTRYFRDKLTPSDNLGAKGKERYVPSADTSLTMLGEKQWNWFNNIVKIKADARIIVSSIQLDANEIPFENIKNKDLKQL